MKKEKMPTDPETAARMAAIIGEGLPDAMAGVYESAATVESTVAGILADDGDLMGEVWAEAARTERNAEYLAAGIQPPRPIRARRVGYGRRLPRE